MYPAEVMTEGFINKGNGKRKRNGVHEQQTDEAGDGPQSPNTKPKWFVCTEQKKKKKNEL